MVGLKVKFETLKVARIKNERKSNCYLKLSERLEFRDFMSKQEDKFYNSKAQRIALCIELDLVLLKGKKISRALHRVFSFTFRYLTASRLYFVLKFEE